MPAVASVRQPRKIRKPPVRLFRVVNPAVNVLLGSPLHIIASEILAVLHVNGRKTGHRYNLPVGYAQDGDRLYISTDKKWCNNLRGGQRIAVTHRGKRRSAFAEVIDDPLAMAEAYRTMYTRGPTYATRLCEWGGFCYGPEGEVHLDEVTRVRDAGHVIIVATFVSAG